MKKKNNFVFITQVINSMFQHFASFHPTMWLLRFSLFLLLFSCFRHISPIAHEYIMHDDVVIRETKIQLNRQEMQYIYAYWPWRNDNKIRTRSNYNWYFSINHNALISALKGRRDLIYTSNFPNQRQNVQKGPQHWRINFTFKLMQTIFWPFSLQIYWIDLLF